MFRDVTLPASKGHVCRSSGSLCRGVHAVLVGGCVEYSSRLHVQGGWEWVARAMTIGQTRFMRKRGRAGRGQRGEDGYTEARPPEGLQARWQVGMGAGERAETRTTRMVV